MQALLLSGLVVSAAGMVCEFMGIVSYDGRLKIFWDSPNQAAMFLAVPFLIGLYFVLKENSANGRTFSFFAVLLIGTSLFFTFSYGAWIGIGAALLIVIFLKYGKTNQWKHFLALFIAMAIVLGSASLIKYRTIQALDQRSSLASRIMIWKSSGRMILQQPIWGIGPGNFQEKYLEYQKFFPPYLEWSAPQPHNIFLAFWLQAGAIGLFGFAWILFLFFQDNKIAIKKNRDLGALLLAAMIWIVVHGMVDTTYWRNDLAVMFWLIVGINLILAKSQSEDISNKS
jgi:putative inorganic carbon (HCO3(-)) transporter